MPRTLYPTTTPRCSRLFAPEAMDQPIGFFLLENLLAARADSRFPTNGAGPDEAVNIYLAHLLGEFLRGHHHPEVCQGSGALFRPPPATDSRRNAAAFYRHNADHRLLHLGLFDWGDALRRRKTLATMSAGETRSRDLAAARACYAMAANLWRGRTGEPAGMVMVWEQLAANLEDYVHVLAVLATRKLGLGARLDPQNLARLISSDDGPVEDDAAAVQSLLQTPPPSEAHDVLLDLWLAHQKNPDPVTRDRIRSMARRLGVQVDLN